MNIACLIFALLRTLSQNAGLMSLSRLVKSMRGSHDLIIPGGGVAGLAIVTSLARRKRAKPHLTVTLVERESVCAWKPTLHTIAAHVKLTNRRPSLSRGRAIRHIY